MRMTFAPNRTRQSLSELLSFSIPTRVPRFTILETHEQGNYKRHLIAYKGDEDDEIRAFLYLPKNKSKVPGIVIHHQHNSEYHLGKSEIAGLLGSKYQAFAPILAKKGFAIIVPDRISFEDRRTNSTGTNAHIDDWQQHYNEFCYRLINGKILATKILNDSTLALNLLAKINCVDSSRLMVIGHSDGGNISLFQSALDKRIACCCASGSLCSYKTKIKNQTGISMMLTIPSILTNFDMIDIVRCIAPRNLLISSANQDKYSIDADRISNLCKSEWKGNTIGLQHYRYQGGHALNKERFMNIVNWVSDSLCKS